MRPMERTLEMVATITGGVIGFFIGLFIIALIAAVALRFAAVILKFGRLGYAVAFKAALLSQFVSLVLQFAVGFQYGWVLAMSRVQMMNSGYGGPSRMYEMAFTFPPTFYLMAMMFSVVATALIFCRVLPTDKDDRQMSFRDAMSLAVVYQALTYAIVILIALFVFVLFMMIWAIT